ncbi:hypothetical protein MKX01_027813 [Papaver californicum]|nr:hypothetical protein MKX01_027813 [Papaver californicum]
MDQEIKAEFKRSGFSLEAEEQEEILKKCFTVCINYKLTPSDLTSNWEAYHLNRDLNGFTIQNSQMDGFLNHLENEQKKANIKEEPYPHLYSSNDVEMLLGDETYDSRGGTIGTPTDRREKLYLDSPQANELMSYSGRPSKRGSNHMTPFGQRTNKFVVQFAFNKSEDTENDVQSKELAVQEDDVIKRIRPIEKCFLEIQGSNPEPGCRFMYDSIDNKFNSIENSIIKHASAIGATRLYEEPVDPTVASNKSVFSVGMVCCDGEGRLNEKSILLQGSVEHCGGQRVRLDLQNLSHYSLFPGQVLGIEGNNPSGHCLIASKVVDSIPLPVLPDIDLPPAKKQAIDQQFQPNSPSNPLTEELSMVIAAGPFSTTDNLLFEPLTELLAYASRKQPQLLVLLGPFVDSEHPEIKKGTVDRSYEEIFNVEIVRRLQDHAEYMGTSARVVLVPSIRDASHDFVFPQPALDLHLSNLKHQISSLPNPARFSANKLKVGCCSVDVLKQLSGEEISRIPADSSSRDRMGRLATHLLNQRSFYPLYPPSEDVPLDLSLAPEALQIPVIPDILILPSDLASFVKVLSVGGKAYGEQPVKCIAVNPGRLAKGVGGGTFVELTYRGDLDRTSAAIIRM